MIELYKGDTVWINLEFRNDDGTVLNLSGTSIYFTVKRNYSDPDIAALISITQTGHDVPQSGLSHIFIDTGDSNHCAGEYVAGFKLKDQYNNVSTFNVESLIILPSTRDYV